MSFLNQLHAAGRMWLRRPGLPALAVASLALAIAAATSVFGVADAALWRPLPLPALTVAAGTLATTMLAVWGPARRASRLDPASTLKQE